MTAIFITGYTTRQIFKNFGVTMVPNDYDLGNEDNQIELEPSCCLGDGISFVYPMKIGAFTYMNNTGIITHCSIGRYCSLAYDVSIGLGDHPTDWLSTSPFQFSHSFRQWTGSSFAIRDALADIHTFIGNDVWIGNGAKI